MNEKKLPIFFIPSGLQYNQTQSVLEKLRLNTVCREALCPNRGECWQQKAIAIQILGKLCTRACGFCGETRGNPKGIIDPEEPQRIASACARLKLSHLVITMPARDDLEDGGAQILAQAIRLIRKDSPETWVDVLTSDFEGRGESLEALASAQPHVFAHNLETVRRLTPFVRSKASYERSLWVLKTAKELGMRIKSGLMVGFGETFDELKEAIGDLGAISVEILTIGQYLAPSAKHYPVAKFYTEDEFKKLEYLAKACDIPFVFSGTLMRSSHYKSQIFDVPVLHSVIF